MYHKTYRERKSRLRFTQTKSQQEKEEGEKSHDTQETRENKKKRNPSFFPFSAFEHS